MMSANELALYLLNNAIKQTQSVSYGMKLIEAREIVLNQLAVSKMFLFDACNIDQKHCRKTLALITEVKSEIEKLNPLNDEILLNKEQN